MIEIAPHKRLPAFNNFFFTLKEYVHDMIIF